MMNDTEIKAAWNTFKRNAKKELSFNPCTFSMNAKQIKNGTATISLCCKTSYEEDIAYHAKSIEQVNGYTGWTDEEKKRSEKYHRSAIRFFEGLKEKYGNPMNEAAAEFDEITHSKAFRKLAETIGIKTTTLEVQGYFYYLRISY